MKIKIKKYPLLITTIISCLIIIASLFTLGFAGLNLGTSLGGGSQFEVNLENDASSKEYVSEIKEVLNRYDFTFDSATLEDKYVAIDNEGNYTSRTLVIKISDNNISDEKRFALVQDVAKAVGVDASYVSVAENITPLVTGKNVLLLGLAIGIVAIALFVFAWVRYDIFAGLSFIVSFLHNIIVSLALVILTRIELSIASLVSMFVLTLVMSILLINIYEKYRAEAKLHISDKLSVSERMIKAEGNLKPFVMVLGAIIVLVAFMAFVPATSVKFTALSILISSAVTIYTAMLIGPALYAALLDLREVRRAAVLSRNDTVNKTIKKKIKKSMKKAEETKKVEELSEDAVVEKSKKTASKKSSKSK